MAAVNVQKSSLFRVKGSRTSIAVLFILLFTVVFLLSGCSADSIAERGAENRIETSLCVSVDEEKYLTHVLVDNIAKYTYEAVNLSKEDAVGTTDGETLLVLESSGKGAIGDLEPGLWEFKVKAYNTRGTLLYVGSSTANVSSNNNTVTVALALRKEGNGTARFKITSKCTGNGTSLVVYYNSYDGRDGGFSEDFACGCDGLTDTWTGTVSLVENRYNLTVRIATDSAYIASDITDLLVLAGETVDITGVLDGQENQSVTVVPVEPVKPEGYIELDGHAKAGNEVTVNWIFSDETKKPDSVKWYMDGILIGTGESLKTTLPGPGMHNLSATAVKGDEYASDRKSLNLCSEPLSLIGGTVVKDYGYTNGTYWFDEYGLYYRKESGDPESMRYLVVNLFEENAETKYTYTEALELEKNLETLGYGAFRLPTREDTHNIIQAITEEKIVLSDDFWTSESYDSSYSFMRRDNGVSVVSNSTKARIILVREI